VTGLRYSRVRRLAAVALLSWAALWHAPAPGAGAEFAVGPRQVLEDPSGEATLEAVLAQRDRFAPLTTAVPNYSFTGSAYWFRLPVENRGNQRLRLYLKSDHIQLDHVELHVVHDGRVRALLRSGDRVPPRARPYAPLPLVLPFDLGPHETVELYVRVRVAGGAMLVPLEVVDVHGLAATLLGRHLIEGVVAGVFGVLFLYNLCLLVLLRERAYLYYVAYLGFAYLGIIGTTGFAYHALLPDSTWFTNEGVIVFSGLSLLSILMFTRTFLRLREQPRLDRVLLGLYGVAVVQIASAFVLPIRTSYVLASVTLSVTPVLSAAIGAVIWRSGRREAMPFTLAHVVGCTGLVWYILIFVGALPYTRVMFQLVPLGLAVAALLHAFALSHRIRLLQEEKLCAEAAVRRSLEMHKDELERVVAQRTAELEKARENAERLATTDPLTGIYNRRGLFDLAERQLELALRHDQPLAVLIFDVDRFKNINDAHGHAEGDRVLCEVVANAKEAIREVDLFGRTGGDEFFLVLPGASGDKAYEIAERLRARIEATVRYGTPPAPVTVSIGAACLNENLNDLDRLETAADAALYLAKRKGRNRIEIERGERRTA
jgi:diguanylate cyclase (GGDEF)-like protein